jgi:hypothetical protein
LDLKPIREKSRARRWRYRRRFLKALRKDLIAASLTPCVPRFLSSPHVSSNLAPHAALAQETALSSREFVFDRDYAATALGAFEGDGNGAVYHVGLSIGEPAAPALRLVASRDD